MYDKSIELIPTSSMLVGHHCQLWDRGISIQTGDIKSDTINQLTLWGKPRSALQEGTNLLSCT